MSLLNLISSAKNRKAQGRKFLSPTGGACVHWQVDKDGDCRITIRDEHKAIHFSDWVLPDTKDITEFDKKMGVLADEIAAFRKALKAKK